MLRAHPFLAALDDQEGAQLLARSAWLLASKSINGAQGLDVTDAMRLSIAAQASLPILNLTPSLYEGWNEIIVSPPASASPLAPGRRRRGARYIEDAAGEAWDGGPVILSWEDAQLSDGSFNVVIHEFAHKLDLQAGDADGMPSLAAHPDIAPRAWRVLEDSLERFIAALDTVEAAIPPDVDPESEEADAWYGQLPMDPYAATDEAEFFAVSSEHFFVDPGPCATRCPNGMPCCAPTTGRIRRSGWHEAAAHRLAFAHRRRAADGRGGGRRRCGGRRRAGARGRFRGHAQRAADAGVDDLLASGGFLFCAPENLASLSGEMKEFFDRCYYGALDRIQGLSMPAPSAPAAMARARARQTERICTGWRLRAAAPALIVNLGAQTPAQIAAPKTVPAADLERCAELGGLLAGLMLLGG